MFKRVCCAKSRAHKIVVIVINVACRVKELRRMSRGLYTG